jgi:copper chaperone
MEKLRFKTNINCGGCVAKVAPELNAAEGISYWNVDTSNSKKILTVETDKLSKEEIIDVVKKAGFKIEDVG